MQIRRAMITAVAVAASAAAVAEEVTVPSRPRLSGEARGNLFAGPKPVVRAPQKTTPVVAPKPSAPTFPYKYGGRVVVGNEAARTYLQKGNELIEIKKGGMLDDAWRVDAVSEDRIEVSFVPGGQQLSMSLASLIGETTGQGGASPRAVAAATRSRAAGGLLQPVETSGTATQSAASTVPPVIGGFVPAPVSPVQKPSPRVAAAAQPVQPSPPATPATGATSSPMQPGPAPSGAMPSSPAPTGRLGVEAPNSGSMPTGPAQAGASGKKLGL